MEKIEQKVHKSARRSHIQEKIMLRMFRMTTSSASLAFASESYLRTRLGLNKGDPTARMNQALHRLQQRGLIRREKGKLTLTSAGKVHIQKIDALERLTVKKPRRWDGKWRVVVFDIWERRRPVRDRLRYLLKKIGFQKIQHSVWVYPYDCEELLAFIRTELRVGGGVIYLIAEGIEHDRALKARFDIP